MKTAFSRVSFVLFLALVLPAISAADNSFKVVAKDKNGNPVPGVTLSVLSGGNKFGAGVTDNNGEQTIPLTLGNTPPQEQMQYVIRKCRREDGSETTEIFILAPGVQLPPQKNCDDHPAGVVPWPGQGKTIVTANIDLDTVVASTADFTSVPGALPSRQLGNAWRPTVDLSLYGGAGDISSHFGLRAGFGVALDFSIGHGFGIGPRFDFRWANPTTVLKFGAMQPESTFGASGVGSKAYPVGVEVWSPHWGGFQASAEGAVLPVSSRLDISTGFCGLTSCMTLPSTITHDTLLGYSFGGRVSYQICPNMSFLGGMGVFGEYRREGGLKETLGTLRIGEQANQYDAGILLQFDGVHRRPKHTVD